LHALDGDDVAAFRVMADAEDSAPSRAWTARARAGRVAIAAMSGERAGARTFADSALELAAEVDWNHTSDEERLALLEPAVVYARLDKPNARRTRWRSLTPASCQWTTT
jgi:hypothetical protein